MLNGSVMTCKEEQCKGATREFKYEQAKYHLLCDQNFSCECPNGCKTTLDSSQSLEEAFKHFDVCAKVARKCPICEEEHNGVIQAQQGDPLACIQHLKSIIKERDETIKILREGQESREDEEND